MLNHLCTSELPQLFKAGFKWCSSCSIFSLCVSFVDRFVLFVVSIVLSVLRFTDSDNSFGIFKLFLPLQEHLSSTPVFVGVHGAWSLVFCVVFCRSLFWVFFSIVLSVLRFTDSDNSFGIFKLFLPLRASELNPSFCGVHGAWLLVFCVVFCRSLFWVFFVHFIVSFDLPILITTLVSSNSSCPY